METRTFEFFRAGSHRSSRGDAITISEAELRQTVEFGNSDAAPPAQLFVDHPRSRDMERPWGTVKRLSLKGASLFAEAEVADELVMSARQGRVRHVSAGFLSPWNPRNSKPGIWALDHVAFLPVGKRPAVKGMAALNFAEVEFAEFCGDDFEIEFGDLRLPAMRTGEPTIGKPGFRARSADDARMALHHKVRALMDGTQRGYAQALEEVRRIDSADEWASKSTMFDPERLDLYRKVLRVAAEKNIPYAAALAETTGRFVQWQK